MFKSPSRDEVLLYKPGIKSIFLKKMKSRRNSNHQHEDVVIPKKQKEGSISKIGKYKNPTYVAVATIPRRVSSDSGSSQVKVPTKSSSIASQENKSSFTTAYPLTTTDSRYGARITVGHEELEITNETLFDENKENIAYLNVNEIKKNSYPKKVAANSSGTEHSNTPSTSNESSFRSSVTDGTKLEGTKNKKNELPMKELRLNNLPPLVSSLTLDVPSGDTISTKGLDIKKRDSKNTQQTSPTSTYACDSGSEDDDDYDQLVSDTERIKYYLAKRNFHLPNNSMWQDWLMYFANNHAILGICFHHPLHPLKLQERLLMLFTSLAVGLGLTSGVILVYADQNKDLNEEVVSLDIYDGHYALTQGMVALWTYGSGLHAAFDFLVWHVFACAFCQQGGPLYKLKCCKWVGANLGLLLCICSVGLSAGFIWQRVIYEGQGKFVISGLHFAVGYFIEMAFALFLYTPLFGTILFSGVLGCYKIPVLGGRAADVASHERWKKAQIKRRKAKLEKKKKQANKVADGV